MLMVLHFLSFLFALLWANPAFALVAGGCGTACMAASQGTQNGPGPDLYAYLIRQLTVVAAFYLSGYALGRLVKRGSLTASVSRKTICLLTFAVSFANSFSVPAGGPALICGLVAFGCILLLLMLGSLALPVRRRMPALDTVFAAINRPEDEPYTLRWLASEAVATSLIIMAFVPLTARVAQDFVGGSQALYALMLIPIFASGIGDALAEIVGKRWGKHHYTTRSFFSGRTYTRSLEGSAMVLLTTVAVGLIVAAQASFLMPVFFWKAFALLPVTLTLAEAFSPHTWDNPLMYLTGYITIALCLL